MGQMNRRRFLQTSSAAGLGFWAAGGASAQERKPGPNDRLNVAVIGAGGQGGGNLNNIAKLGENIVALCDVDERRAGGNFNKFVQAVKFNDFRVMLDKMHKQIDAVVVSTPDHTHAAASVAAMRLGKHCYCEKPLTWSVHEARLMREVAAKHKVATQMGNQGTSNNNLRTAVEIIRSGALGDVRELHVWTNRPIWPQGMMDRPQGQQEIPQGLHWDLWLGPAPERPYHQAYLPFAARGIFSLDVQGSVRTHGIDLAESQRRSWEAQMHFSRYLYPRASRARIELERRQSRRWVRWMARLTASLSELRLSGVALRSLTRPADEGDGGGELTFVSTLMGTVSTAGHLRLVDFASNWGMLYKSGDEMTAPLYANLFRVFASMQKTASSRGATFVLVYFPRREQVQPQDWRRFQTFWNLDPNDFDLDREAARLRAFCAAQGIPFIDTTPALRAAAVDRSLYLPHDAHFNEQGQAVAAQAILDFMAGGQGAAVRGAGS